MTDDEWDTCTTRPAAMFSFAAPKAPLRKAVLAGCGCGRAVWADLPAEWRAAVERLEKFADHETDEATYRAELPALVAGEMPWNTRENDPAAVGADAGRQAALYVANALCRMSLDRPLLAVDYALGWAEAWAGRTAADGKRPAVTAARRRFCDLFREVYGSPHRPRKVLVTTGGWGYLQPDGKITTLSTTARELAKAIAAEQAFERLPILADAVEESGCTDDELLAHLRGPGPHARGCWALDVLTGRG